MSSPTPTTPFSISESLIPIRSAKPPSLTILSFSSLLSPPLQLHQDLKEGCGGQLWPAGMVLAQFLLERMDDWRGKTIVELGAGGGLVGLALALGLAQKEVLDNVTSIYTPPILITDLDILLPLQAHNISLNALPPSSILSASLPWGEPVPPSISASHHRPDVLLAADCVYFEPAFPLLLKSMDAMMSSNTVCWFCMKKRRRADMVFIKRLRKRFEVQNVEFEAGGERGVFLYKIRRKKRPLSEGQEDLMVYMKATETKR